MLKCCCFWRGDYETDESGKIVAQDWGDVLYPNQEKRTNKEEFLLLEIAPILNRLLSAVFQEILLELFVAEVGVLRDIQRLHAQLREDIPEYSALKKYNDHVPELVEKIKKCDRFDSCRTTREVYKGCFWRSQRLAMLEQRINEGTITQRQLTDEVSERLNERFFDQVECRSLLTLLGGIVTERVNCFKSFSVFVETNSDDTSKFRLFSTLCFGEVSLVSNKLVFSSEIELTDAPGLRAEGCFVENCFTFKDQMTYGQLSQISRAASFDLDAALKGGGYLEAQLKAHHDSLRRLSFS